MEYDLIDISSGCITLALAIILLNLQMPPVSLWSTMRRMLRLLSVCYFCIGVSNIIRGLAGVSDTGSTQIGIAILLVALFQALFLTATCLAFVSPHRVGVKWLTTNILSASAVCAASIYALIEFEMAANWIWTIDTIIYIIQLIYYCLLFKNSYISCAKTLEENYDDDMSYGLRWIRNCFLGGLMVGISALLFVVFRCGSLMYSIFTCVYTVYYVYLVHCVINYRIKAGYIVKVVAADGTETYLHRTMVEQLESKLSGEIQIDERALKKAIDEWVSKKEFVKNDQTMEEIALQLDVTHTELKWYFTNRLHTTFRTWRLMLRIEEAKRLLREEDVSVANVHTQVGIADKSNFHKQFRQITGMTPKEYVESNGI